MGASSAEALFAHLRSIGVNAEPAMRREIGEKRIPFAPEISREGLVLQEMGIIKLKNQAVDDIVVRRSRHFQKFAIPSGYEYTYWVNYRVHRPLPRILEGAVTIREQGTLVPLVKRWMRERPKVAGVRIAWARPVRGFPFFGKVRDIEWGGGELAQVLTQDTALTAMLMRARLRDVTVFRLVPGDMVEISSPFKLPSLADLEAYNRIAQRVKEM